MLRQLHKIALRETARCVLYRYAHFATGPTRRFTRLRLDIVRPRYDGVENVVKRIRNVWEDLGFSPDEATDLAKRAGLMIALRPIFEGVDPKESGKRYAVDPAMVSDVLAGRIDRLTTDDLSGLTAAVANLEGRLPKADQ